MITRHSDFPNEVKTDVRCPACEKGNLRTATLDYEVSLADGTIVTVPNLAVEQCDHCGEVALSPRAAAAVDAAVAEKTEPLSPSDLERIREDCGVDQNEMSEILGLGEKTYHRWEKGNRIPSRSMGYYIRILAEFPDAFAWLRDRGWRKKNRVLRFVAAAEFRDAFPDLGSEIEIATLRSSTSRFNPARALFGSPRK